MTDAQKRLAAILCGLCAIAVVAVCGRAVWRAIAESSDGELDLVDATPDPEPTPAPPAPEPPSGDPSAMGESDVT